MKNLLFKKRWNAVQQDTSVVRASFVSKQKAFTLVETLVAISILVVSIIGPLVIISQALRTSFFARDQITAFFLAQEVVEYTRNIRDRNSLRESDPLDWLNGIATDNPDGPPIAAELDGFGVQKYNLIRGTDGYELVACPSEGCPKVSLNKTTGVYGSIATVEPSIYTREITFHKAPGDGDIEQEITVQITMFWNQVGGVYQFKLRENLTNWKIQNYDVN